MANAVEKKKNKFESHTGSYAKPLLAGVIAGVLTMAAVLLLCAAVLACFALPPAVMRTMGLLTVISGGFFGGLIAASAIGKKGFLVGLSIGVILALMLTVASVLWLKSMPSAESFSKLAVLIVSAMIGGVLGVNHPHKRK
ncbi:MAG: TIGR04086 family membrane protein [Oscillospiraceae bacterium]